MTIRRKLIKRVLILSLFAVVFLIAAGVGSMGWIHFGNPKHTCASCHEMAGQHASWSASAHSSLHCRNCHGGSLTLDVHALKAHLNRAIQHFRRDPNKPISLAEADLLKLHATCRDCHPQSFAEWEGSRHAATYARIFLDQKHNKAEQPAPDCLRCHGMFFDGHIEDLVSPVNSTGPWALKDSAKATQPTIPCLACHKVHTPAESGVAQLYVRRERTHFPAGMLAMANVKQGERAVKESSDPRQRLCVQCHAPNALRQLGSSDDRTPAGVHEGLSCLDCHSTHSGSTKASCATCHLAKSNCGLDVEKMDTSYKSAGSRHNIHTVACGDCHNGQRPQKK